MLIFKKEQKILEIGGVKLGGQPGQLPTVLIGSMFHLGHRIVKDQKRGHFDRAEAKHLINLQQELSDATGNPHMLDIVGQTSEALIRYVDFASDQTDAPLLVNGPQPAVRLDAFQHADEIGISDRAIYNSVNYTASMHELSALGELHVKAAVVQAFNPRNPWIEGMRQQLVGSCEQKGLIQKASAAGIEKVLVLTPVLDVPSIGIAAEGIRVLKEELGLPTGTAPLGVLARWRKGRKFGPISKRLGRTVAATLAQSMGSNFIIYGSVRKAPDIFPACALGDALIAYSAAARGVKPLTRNHPLYKIF